MKRRHFLLGSAALAATGLGLLRPADQGGGYSPYFATLNQSLRRHGPGRPLLVLDRDRLLANAAKIQAHMAPAKALRLVEKSLPSLPLLQLLMQKMATQRLMVFHQPHLNAVAAALPEADLLLGKPMPAQAVATFYRELKSDRFQPARQLQWLIDSRDRLLAYQQLARQLGTRMRVNLEIDVGLHRGGLRHTEELSSLLDIMAPPDSALEFAGFMGYDAHVGKIPGILESRDESLAKACARYRDFQNALFARLPELRNKPLTFNGAGSPTLRLHGKDSPLNELAAGSAFVKPLDFDLELLSDLEPAAFIATPVLKTLDGVTIPGIEGLRPMLAAWNRNQERSYFIYGGYWLANYESPAGLFDNGLYGHSSNQAIVTSSARVNLQVDDHIFLRPNQSERLLQEFGDIAVVSQGQLVDWWPVMSS